MHSAEDKSELVVSGAAGDSGVRQVQHGDVVLTGVGGVADVHGAEDQADSVAGGGAVGEAEVAGRPIRDGGCEVVLLGDGWDFDDNGASDVSLGDQHLLSAADQFAVDDVVADVHADRLETGVCVGVQLEGGGVALFEDLRGGLVGVGDRAGGSGVSGGVVDASHGELDCRDRTDLPAERERATGAGDAVEQTIYVVVDSGAFKTVADGFVGNVGCNAVTAGCSRYKCGADRANSSYFCRADVIGDQANVATACAAGNSDDLSDVGVICWACAGRKSDGVGRTCRSSACDCAACRSWSQGTGSKGVAVARGRASSTGASEFDGELALDAGVGQELLGGTQIGANEVAAHDVTLHGSDGEVADQHSVGAGWGDVGAVCGLSLDQDQAFAEEKGHWDYLSGGVGGSVREIRVRTPVSGSRR